MIIVPFALGRWFLQTIICLQQEPVAIQSPLVTPCHQRCDNDMYLLLQRQSSKIDLRLPDELTSLCGTCQE